MSRDDPPSSNNAQTGFSFLNLQARATTRQDRTPRAKSEPSRSCGVDSAVCTGFRTMESHRNGLHRGKSLVARDALPNIFDAQKVAGQVARPCCDDDPLPSARSLWRMAVGAQCAW